MRQRQEILKQAQDAMHHPKLEVLETSKLQYLLIEVLVDMRDLHKEELDYYKGGVGAIQPSSEEGD